MATSNKSPTSYETDPAHTPAIESLGSRRHGREAPEHRRTHIVLFGLMGSGKSTVGRLVANELGRPFVDSDSIVELRSGQVPHVLAEREGLDELHRIELLCARHVLATSSSVVFAAAASVIEELESNDLKAAFSIWLDTSPAELARRVAGDGPRPALGSTPEQALADQHRRRAPRARELVHVVVDTDDRTPTEVAAVICDHWRSFAAPSNTTR